MDSVRVILGAVLIAISPIVGSAGTCSWRTDVTRGAWSSSLISSRFGRSEADCGLIFEVARESPVFTNRVERNVDQDLFRWNTEGWAFDAENANESKRYDLHDYTHLVRPERNLANRIIRRFDLVIRGTDEQEHPDAATLRKTGAVAYAVGYHLARDPGFAVIVTGPKTQRNRPSEQ